MGKFTKIISLIAASVMTISALAGCGTGADSELKEVQIWSHNSHSKAFMNEKVDEFNQTKGRELGVKLVYTVKESDIQQAAEMAYASDQGPDFISQINIEKNRTLGNIMSIEDIEGGKEWIESTYKPQMYDRAAFKGSDGKIYTLPFNVITYGIVYNKDMFKKYGIVDENGEPTPPETFEEMREYAKKMTNPEKEDYGIILPEKWGAFVSVDVLQLVYSSTGMGIFNCIEGKYDFSGIKPILEMYCGMMEDGSVFPGGESLDNDMARAYFAERNIGMKFAGSYDVGVFNSQFKAKCDWGVDKYEAVLTIDTRKLPYEKVLSDTSRQWYDDENTIPQAAKEPIYSTWYAYHQNLKHDELIKELKSAKQIGMETVIVDDGWQTLDGQRGYAHCGDWEPERLSDMKGFVSDVHNMGMKCMLWFGVPFVGKYSKAWGKFQGKFLNDYDEKHPWCVLDPRYPKVREYLINIYEKAVKEWDLDGLKLDFINNMQLTEASCRTDNEMDYISLEEAICELLAEIKERLTAIKSDILIEFRQPYTGPVMRRYGNMLRVADCPQDAIKNRAGIVDLRLLAGKTAVHSDMLMWNYDDTAESAALQLINVLFAVPQVSVLIERLCEEHRKMLEFYLRFWKENRECLIDGKLSAENPEAGYSLITGETEYKIIGASYIKNVMSIKKAYKEIVFINGSWDDEMLIKNKYDEMKAEYKIYTCTGDITESKTIVLKNGVNVFTVPKSGLVRLDIFCDGLKNTVLNYEED